VQFGNYYKRQDNTPPFSVGGDNKGKYQDWLPREGVHTLKATPYSKTDSKGLKGRSLSIQLTIRPAPEINFTLFDEGTRTDLMPLLNGAEIDLAALPPELNITAKTEWKDAESIRFGFHGNPDFRVDNLPPYTLFIDSNEDDYRVWNPEAGLYTLTATAFARDNAAGTIGPSKTITFRIKNSAPPSATAYIELNNLLVVYKNANKGSIPDTYGSRIPPVLEEVNQYYWRNTHMGLNLKWTILVMEDFLVRVHEPDFVLPSEVDADLRSRGFTDGAFDAVGVVIAGGGAYAHGVDRILGRGGFFQVPWWGNDNDDQLLFSWFIVHEFHHVLDAMFAQAGYPLYPHNHPGAARFNGEYVPNTGTDWDLNAGILRNWKYSQWPDLRRKGNWGTIAFPLDADADTIPDLEAGVPLDEARFKSSPTAADTEGDGLTDLQEVMAGIFTGSNPLHDDSDKDGIVDRQDAEPIYPLNTRLAFQTNLTLNQDVTTWPLAGNYFFRKPEAVSSSLHLAHATDRLYVGVKVPAMPASRLRVFLDANNDGLFYGKDNIEIMLNGNVVESVQLYDAASVPPGNQDDFLVSALPTAGFSGATKSHSGGFSYQLIIPKLTPYGLDLEAGEEIGILIQFDFGTLLEKDDFLTVTLGGNNAALLADLGKEPARINSNRGHNEDGARALVFPNPATQEIQLRLDAAGGPGLVRIVDVNGVEQIRTSINPGSLQSIDVTGLSPGLYWLYVDSTVRRSPFPFIKK
jgi:hypothetical protein